MRHIRKFRTAAVFALTMGALTTQADAKPSFTLYGTAQLDYIYDVHRVDPSWEDALRPSKIPTTEGLFGSNGQSLFSVKQSRFGVTGDVPVGRKLSDIDFKFEFDMFGVGADAGKTTIRLRHAYVQWGDLLAGQTNSVFMDGAAFPNVIDYWRPTG
ncbi:MAG TPA: DcaP family trimeric outer membrane transporter, partial [Terriglobales bacterium]|nr:DcaP family trimeric outer membrane transporter [Terriglobales bacterium]